MSDDPAEGIRGFALLGGMDVQSGIIYIFQQTSFVTIEHVLGDDGGIRFKGLCEWFNRCWSKYFGASFFYHGSGARGETYKSYLLQILRSPMVDPTPHFTEILWGDNVDAELRIWEQLTLKKLQHRNDEPLMNALTSYSVDHERKSPEIFALMSLLMGFERFPYRKSKKKTRKPFDFLEIA